MKEKLKKFYADHEETIKFVGAFAAVAGGAFTVGFIVAALNAPDENPIEDMCYQKKTDVDDIGALAVTYRNGTKEVYFLDNRDQE